MQEDDENISSAFTAKKNQIIQSLAAPSDQYDDLSPKGSIDAEIVDLVNEINLYKGLVTTSSCAGRISVFVEGRRPIKGKEDIFVKCSNEEIHNETVGSQLVKDEPDGNEEEDDVRGYSTSSASVGGKGGGGYWAFVSHSPLPLESKKMIDKSPHPPLQTFQKLFQLKSAPTDSLGKYCTTQSRLIHFKFEPMTTFSHPATDETSLPYQILHVLAANTSIAQRLLSAAMQCGFRESGISSLHVSSNYRMTAQLPIPVAIRTTGLAFDNIIGVAIDNNLSGESSPCINYAIVTEEYLEMLVDIAAEKFEINQQRRDKFRTLLASEFGIGMAHATGHDNGFHQSQTRQMPWEDKDARRARKREEGLKRRDELKQTAKSSKSIGKEELDHFGAET